MAVSKYKTFVDGEVLTAADLNASLDQVFNNQESLGYPRTTSADFNGVEIILDADGDTSLRETSDDVLALKMQGQDVFIFDGDAASANNGFRFTAGTTAAPQVSIDAQGTPTDIGVNIRAKGTASIFLGATNGVDIDGKPLILDTDADTTLRETSDDVLTLKMQGVDLFVFDGDAASASAGLRFTAGTSGGFITPEGAAASLDVSIQPKGGSGFVRLGVGGGPVITTPTAAGIPVADGSGKIALGWLQGLPKLLGTYAPSGAASVDITSKITSAYNRYMIWFNLRPSNDGANAALRTSTNNGSSWDSGASNYPWVSITDATKTASSDTSAIIVSSVIGNATNEGIAGCLFIDFLGSASMYPLLSFRGGYLDTSTVLHALSGSFTRASAAAINAVQLTVGTTCTGTVEVYGWENA